MLRFREGWRSFKEGLDRRFLCDYWRAVWNHAWQIFWGAGAVGVILTAFTLYDSPSWKALGWVVACLGFSGSWLLRMALRPCSAYSKTGDTGNTYSGNSSYAWRQYCGSQDIRSTCTETPDGFPCI